MIMLKSTAQAAALATHPRFVASRTWSPERPENLVVTCSDGRYHPQMEEFIRAEVSETPDLVAVPGGPVVIDPWASSFDQGRATDEALRLLFTMHELRRVWLLAHQGCAFYLNKFGPLGEDQLKRWQVRDLRSARRRLLERWPGVEVRLVYVSLEESRVVFSPLGDRSA